MPTKTYTREVQTLFTREEMAGLLKEAHNYCKSKVPRVYHKIGRTRPRSVIFRTRDSYLSCIKEYINQKVQERVRAQTGAKA
jgi:hypothetical protein